MAFKNDDSPIIGGDQADSLFNDDVSVSLFTELNKENKVESSEKESTFIPETISTSNGDPDDDDTNHNIITPPTTRSSSSDNSLELPSEWRDALEKEFSSENPSLIGWEGEDGKFVIPKTFDELKDLIDQNKKYEVEENKKKWETETVDGLSPQVKSIMEYAKAGGKDVTPLLESWATVESISQLDPNNISDAEELVRYDLESKGLDEDDIDEQVEFFKNTNKIFSKAHSIKPKLEQQEVEKIAHMQQMQMHRSQELQAKRVEYQTNMSNAIEKTFTDSSVSKNIKHSIFEPVYESSFRPGLKITGFQKSLEDLQLDPSKNEHFAELALLASDRDKFFEVYGSKIKREVTADTVKKLKFSKNNNASMEDEADGKLNAPTKLRGFRPTWKD